MAVAVLVGIGVGVERVVFTVGVYVGVAVLVGIGVGVALVEFTVGVGLGVAEIQTPEEQLVHILPHCPQLFRSFIGSMQTPLHFI